MNEYIEIRFRRKNKPLRVRRQVPDGIELDERDPLQRSVRITFGAVGDVTEYRMRRVRQLQGWDPGQFKFKMSVEDGAIVLRGVDARSLPPGRYRLRVHLEEGKCRQPSSMVSVAEDGHGVLLVDVEIDDRDVAVDLTSCDAHIQRVLDASTLDGQPGGAWLESDCYPTRKACLLNLLASLRVRPTQADPLIAQVRLFLHVTNDRAYGMAARDLFTRVHALARDPKKPFYLEGTPKAAIHRRLLDFIPDNGDRQLFTPEGLVSFRGEGRPSLQMVIATPPEGFDHTYVEFDLDLGNPLQDISGLVVHMGELVDKKPTNHLDLRVDLSRTSAADFLYYSVTA